MSVIEQEILQMLDGYIRSVERRELKTFLAFFAKGEGLTVFEDKEMYDWKGFVAFAEGFFQQIAQVSIQLEKCAVDPIATKAAVVTGVFKVTGTTISGEDLAIHNSYTFVLVKQDDRWLIKHVHECSL